MQLISSISVEFCITEKKIYQFQHRTSQAVVYGLNDADV